MINYLVIVISLVILCFIIFLAGRAIKTGFEAKQHNLRSENLDNVTVEENELNETQNNHSVTDELIKLEKLHKEGTINDTEFKKAKEKILS
tara:strand:- start:277 stop:549 length:273 start_codon:yes stop_codon:yes gene_type:complete